MSPLFGINIIESEHAWRWAYRIIKTHPRARRKRYGVQKYKQPCAFIIAGDWHVHPRVVAEIRLTGEAVA